MWAVCIKSASPPILEEEQSYPNDNLRRNVSDIVQIAFLVFFVIVCAVAIPFSKHLED